MHVSVFEAVVCDPRVSAGFAAKIVERFQREPEFVQMCLRAVDRGFGHRFLDAIAEQVLHFPDSAALAPLFADSLRRAKGRTLTVLAGILASFLRTGVSHRETGKLCPFWCRLRLRGTKMPERQWPKSAKIPAMRFI
jgi:hypothetical protein